MYNESHAGVQLEPSPYGSHQAHTPPPHPPAKFPHNPQFPPGINPFWPNGSLLPLVSSAGTAPVGSGDGRVQAYNFRRECHSPCVTCVRLCDGACRLCMTQNTSNMLPFAPPLNYDASAWELARRYISAANVTSLGQLMILSGVGEGKTHTNNRCLHIPGVCVRCHTFLRAGGRCRRIVWVAGVRARAGACAGDCA